MNDTDSDIWNDEEYWKYCENEYRNEIYKEWCEENKEPIYELGQIVAYQYPNGYLEMIDDEEEREYRPRKQKSPIEVVVTR